MKNFIFKSEADFHKILFNQLKMILSEQRHARSDLVTLKIGIASILNDRKLQKQVDDYFEDDTSPQTDSETKDDGN